MVKIIKLDTWKTLNFDSTFLAQLVFEYLEQNRITHYQSSVFLPCVRVYIFWIFQTGMGYVIDCRAIIFIKFSCFLDLHFKFIHSAVDGFCKIEINFIVIIRSANSNAVD